MYVKFTEKIQRKRKTRTNDDVNNAGHTTRRKIVLRKDNSNDANAKSDGLVRMTKEMESKFKLLLAATIMKNQNHGNGDAGDTIQRNVVPTGNNNGNGNATSTTNGANTKTKTEIKRNNKDVRSRDCFESSLPHPPLTTAITIKHQQQRQQGLITTQKIFTGYLLKVTDTQLP